MLHFHTDRGSDLILMRLSDALTELKGLEGAQTHRSWWVAAEQLVGFYNAYQLTKDAQFKTKAEKS